MPITAHFGEVLCKRQNFRQFPVHDNVISGMYPRLRNLLAGSNPDNIAGSDDVIPLETLRDRKIDFGASCRNFPADFTADNKFRAGPGLHEPVQIPMVTEWTAFRPDHCVCEPT
jgi:hypothetical protein